MWNTIWCNDLLSDIHAAPCAVFWGQEWGPIHLAEQTVLIVIISVEQKQLHLRMQMQTFSVVGYVHYQSVKGLIKCIHDNQSQLKDD